ncbi:hypothetical protein FisN_17Lh051 [Fistulifera solaris]|uniref:Uncharacterized protein n=1 Tax=Fistulifera solaris TaxID=1519565 RepID=A0A1Z5J5W9_FISSO|nr:hypothetical protein FisN_17Lh051 [Fistulifera solaris]|eukprot:GAX09302.1 hypothetical protein FisN_17Lh051 [Fistulifera solaris]
MNPLDIQIDRFIVATTANDELVGWAQLKPMKSLMMQDPARYDARPGSYDLEQEVDDDMWDDFEQDNFVQIPNGLASLPWTKEYQQMQKRFATGRNEGNRFGLYEKRIGKGCNSMNCRLCMLILRIGNKGLEESL